MRDAYNARRRSPADMREYAERRSVQEEDIARGEVATCVWWSDMPKRPTSVGEVPTWGGGTHVGWKEATWVQVATWVRVVMWGGAWSREWELVARVEGGGGAILYSRGDLVNSRCCCCWWRGNWPPKSWPLGTTVRSSSWHRSRSKLSFNWYAPKILSYSTKYGSWNQGKAIQWAAQSHPRVHSNSTTLAASPQSCSSASIVL